MKKSILSILTLLLALVLLLCSCSNHGKTLLEAGKNEVSVNVYKLYLSRMKGSLSSAGNDVNSDKYWNTYLSTDGLTVKDFYSEQVFEGLRQITAALYIYDELGLELSKETKDSIDEWIDTLIEEMGEGSKSQLNSILSSYGANVTVLKDAAIIEAKLEQLKVYLYGEGGSLIGSPAKEEFYQDSYYRGYQMLLANYYYDHEKKDGYSVYYGEGGKIAYDTVNGVATEEKDDNGDTVYREFGPIAYDTKNGTPTEERDEEGYRIYVNSEGKIAYDTEKGKATDKTDKNSDTVYRYWVVAYDTENGTLKYYEDEKTGTRKTVMYDAEEMGRTLWMANQIAEKCQGDEALFLAQMEAYGDNQAFNEEMAPNGMYFSAGSMTGEDVFYTFSTELAKLEVGDLVVLESSSGYYILMRASLDEGAWSKSENSTWFSTFSGLCMEYMLQKKTLDYLQYVTVDEELKKSEDITMVGTNLYY